MSEETKPRVAYHTVELGTPAFDDAISQMLTKKKKSIRITIPETDDGECNRLIETGEMFVGHLVSVNFQTSRVILATYRDPVTRRKVGYVPTEKKRKRTFVYPASDEDNDVLQMNAKLGDKTTPDALRRIAFLAIPETIEVFSGDYKLREHLTKLARKEMWRFKIRRLREPFEHLIQAFSTPLPKVIADLLNGLPK